MQDKKAPLRLNVVKFLPDPYPIHTLIAAGELNAIRLHLANVKTILPLSKNNEGKTALDLAEDMRRLDIVELLVPYYYFRKNHVHMGENNGATVLRDLIYQLGLANIATDPNAALLNRKNFTAAIDSAIQNSHYDSDLWDDIFDDDEIFRPVHDGDEEKNVDYYFDNIRDEFNSDADCRGFIKNRLHLFRFYAFLRQCTIAYRDLGTDLLLKNQCGAIINFIIHDSNKEWFSEKLRVKAFARTGENWKSGMHEWLACSLTPEAILRTAGLRQDIEPCLPECLWAYLDHEAKQQLYFCAEFNWLDLQFLVRTPTKFMAFSHLESGHVRSLNISPFPTGRGNPGFLTAGNGDLNTCLKNIFNSSHNIKDFISLVHEKYSIGIFNDKTPVQPTAEPHYLVDGTATNNPAQLIQHQQRLVKTHRGFRRWHTDMIIHNHVKNYVTDPNTAPEVVGKIKDICELANNNH